MYYPKVLELSDSELELLLASVHDRIEKVNGLIDIRTTEGEDIVNLQKLHSYLVDLYSKMAKKL